jgi:hypothetical protein
VAFASETRVLEFAETQRKAVVRGQSGISV